MDKPKGSLRLNTSRGNTVTNDTADINSIDSESEQPVVPPSNMSVPEDFPQPLRKFARLWVGYDLHGLEEYETLYDNIRNDRSTYGTPFATCIDLMKSLDQLESVGSIVKGMEGELHLVHYMYSHWQLYKLQEGIELKFHIVAPYWVKTVLKWDERLGYSRSAEPTAGPKREAKQMVVRYLKHILTELRQSSGSVVLSPFDDHIREPHNDLTPDFRIEEYIEILDQQGIPWRSWYKSELPTAALKINLDNAYPSLEYFRHQMLLFDTSDSDGEIPKKKDSLDADTSEQSAHIILPPSLKSLPQSFEDLERRVNLLTENIERAEEILQIARHDSLQAQQILVNMPVDLKYMEILNTILAIQGKDSLMFDKTVIASGYIQHGLRILERPQDDLSTPSVAYSPTDDPVEKSRKIKLLVLFIKNLVKKSIVPPENLQFDIQEICTRYVGIKEVRDFQYWLETGEEV